jgi:hypothetical protein
MLGILLAVILEGVHANAVKRHAAQVTGGNDAVGIDVIQEERNARALDLFDFRHWKLVLSNGF